MIPISKHLVKLILILCFAQNIHAAECIFSRQLDTFEDISFAPNEAVSRTQIHVQLETNATLFRRTAPTVGKLQNELAKSVEVDQDSGRMTVKLDPSCHWSDGMPITAEDYLAGLKLLFTPESLESNIQVRMMLANARQISEGEISVSELGVRVLSDDTLEFDVSSSSGVLKNVLTYVGFTPAPTHLIEKNAEAWPIDSIVRVSSGPFYATEIEDGLITLQRNQYYCEGFKSNIEKVYLHGVPARGTPAIRFLGGEIDVAEELTQSALTALKKKRQEGSLQFTLVESHEEVMSYVAISPQGRLAKLPEVQRALLLSIDRERLLGIIAGGGTNARKHDGVSFKYPGYNPGEIDSSFNRPYEERVKQARQIMQDLGYSDQNMLDISLGIRPSSPYEQTGYAISSMFNAIYVNAEPELVRSQDERMQKDVAVNAWGSDYPDPENTLAGIANALQGYDNGHLDRLLAVSYETPSEVKRLEALKRVENDILQSGLYLPLYQLTSPWIFAPDIQLLNENYAIARNVRRSSCDQSK